MTVWLRLYRLITRAARFESTDLRTPDAEATFRKICESAIPRGAPAVAFTALRELLIIAGVIAFAYVPAVPRPRLPGMGEPARRVRLGLRALFRTHRGYAAIATFVLAVSIGVNLLVFTVVNALWIRPMAYPDPDRVVIVTGRTWGSLEWLQQHEVFGAGVAGQVETTEYQAGLRPHIEIAGRLPETLGVTPDYFQVLRLQIRGRDFSAADEIDGAEPVAIISDRLWAGAFGRRQDVIGAVLTEKPMRLRVIGIAPRAFAGVRRGEQADVWVPAGVVRRLAPAEWEGRGVALTAFGRLGPGQTVSMADQRFWELHDPRTREHYESLQIRMDRRPRVVPAADVFGAPDAQTFMVRERDAALVVAGLALLVLLGGCATIAALVLVHYERRRTELAVKMSLGAGRARLAGELLCELSLLALMGSAGGIVVSMLGVRVLPAMSLPGGVHIGRLDLSIDWRVCAVALAATLATVVVAAALPVLRATRRRLATELVGGSSSVTLASQRVRQGLLSLQVCATIIVLVSAGLFVRTVGHGFGAGGGFDIDRTVFVSIQEQGPWRTTGYRPDVIAARNARLIETLRAIPGVEVAAEGLPPIGPADRFVIKKLKVNEQEHAVSVAQHRGGPELLAALGVPVLHGRSLTHADAAATPQPAVITQSLARRLWPNGDALGQPLRAPVSRYGPFVVVGIATDFPFGSLTAGGDGAVVTARPVLNGVVSFFVVRTPQPAVVAGSIRQTIRGLSVTAATGKEIIARDMARQQLGAWFFSGFGLAALALGIGGAFGLVAYLAESHRREFGVRLALGADTFDLMRLGLASALMPVAIGAAAGLLLAGIVSRVFQALLTGISALDPATYAVVAILMLGSAALAALAAIWRVRGISPSDALRTT